MPKTLVSPIAKDYQKLLSDIRGEMARGIRKIEELLERQKVISNWAIGRNINAYLTELFLSQYIKEAQYIDDSSLEKLLVRRRIVNKEN